MLDDETPLFRVVHPKWIQKDRITSEVFRPFGDEDELSMYHGHMVTPEEAFKHFTSEQGNPGVRVVCVRVRTFHEFKLPVTHDGNPHPAHVTVDYSSIKGDNPRRRLSQKIKAQSKEVYRVD